MGRCVVYLTGGRAALLYKCACIRREQQSWLYLATASVQFIRDPLSVSPLILALADCMPPTGPEYMYVLYVHVHT